MGVTEKEFQLDTQIDIENHMRDIFFSIFRQVSGMKLLLRGVEL